MAILHSMLKNSFYFAESDYDYFSLLYLTEVEKRRSDVRLLMTSFLEKNYECDLVRRNHPELSTLFPTTARSIQITSSRAAMYCAFSNGSFSALCLDRGLAFF